jgi:hypothetical protein
MLKAIITTTALICSLAAFSQVSETRTVNDFSKLKASTSVKVFYTIAAAKSVKVETDDNEKLKFIKTEVENGTLKIFVDNNGNYTGSKKGGKNINGVRFKTLKVYVSGPSLSSFKASSSAHIKIENLNSADQVDIDVSSSASISGKFDCSNITIDASSSGDFKAQIDAKSVEVETSSSSGVILSGKTVRLKVDSSSSSSCKADKLIAEEVTATANSSADIDIYASKSLNAKASSSADIDYYGNPSQVAADKNSSGSISKK